MSPNIVNCLVNVSEKAANIARLMRQHDYLFSLLVQEKSIDESNSERFVHDYKTLADVLIQQTVRHDIGVSVRNFGDNFLFFFSKIFAHLDMDTGAQYFYTLFLGE